MSKLKTGTTIGGSTAWHAGNHGTGSGLDADTLDGQEGTYYLNDGDFTSNGFMKRTAAGVYTVDTNTYLTAETSHADVLVDGDFASAGFMKTDGSGNYSVDSNSYLTAETSHADVLVDGDFTSNGFMKRTAAGVYTVDTNTYLTNVVSDTSPQLGGNLDGNSKSISGVTDLTISGDISLSNGAITGVDYFTFNDPGPNEGISWGGGNFSIYESPDDLTTNSAGNLQFVVKSVSPPLRAMTITTSGNVNTSGDVELITNGKAVKVNNTPGTWSMYTDTAGDLIFDFA